MGAVHKLDLTSDVTHLIVGNTETPKYQYVAKQRPDVKVLRPEWVEAVRLSWMEGGDTDVAALEEEYRLATFAGLTICVTGFDDLEQRTRIQNTVVANGAEYHGDLTRVVSHLIAAAPQGAKYEHSRQWGIKTVSLLWLEDSIERGMVLDETLYDPRLPAEEQGKGAWIRAVKQPTSAKRRARPENVTEAPDAGKRKLRRTASTKLNSQSEMLWASFSRGGDSMSKGAEDRLNPAGFDESKSTRQSGANSERTSVGKSAATGSPVPVRPAGGYPQVAVGEGLSGLFQGIPIFTHGFSGKKVLICTIATISDVTTDWDQRETLHAHLCSRGACLIPDIEGLGHLAEDQLRRGIVVVPHDSPRTLIKSLPEEISRLTLASE
ncbi:protein kinase activating protein dpb11, partial [Cryomyces antarcticus]